MTNVRWAGLAPISRIFFASALAVIDRATAARELTAAGVAERLAKAAARDGRIFQLIAVPAVFVSLARPYPALGLAAFLIPATLTAHSFCKSASERRDMQLAGFLKNAPVVVGLVFAAAERSPP